MYLLVVQFGDTLYISINYTLAVSFVAKEVPKHSCHLGLLGADQTDATLGGCTAVPAVD